MFTMIPKKLRLVLMMAVALPLFLHILKHDEEAVSGMPLQPVTEALATPFVVVAIWSRQHAACLLFSARSSKQRIQRNAPVGAINDILWLATGQQSSAVETGEQGLGTAAL
jgi:hypothetical protein